MSLSIDDEKSVRSAIFRFGLKNFVELLEIVFVHRQADLRPLMRLEDQGRFPRLSFPIAMPPDGRESHAPHLHLEESQLIHRNEFRRLNVVVEDFLVSIRKIIEKNEQMIGITSNKLIGKEWNWGPFLFHREFTNCFDSEREKQRFDQISFVIGSLMKTRRHLLVEPTDQ